MHIIGTYLVTSVHEKIAIKDIELNFKMRKKIKQLIGSNKAKPRVTVAMKLLIREDLI
jgi:hypothetical protein